MTKVVKDNLDWAVDRFVQKDNPIEPDLLLVEVVAQIQSKLEAFRARASEMTEEELELETHNSNRMASHLAQAGDPKPHDLCHAHAIVSGKHAGAGRLRAILAWAKMRIDDPNNGCWLPRNSEAVAKMPPQLKRAAPHSRIHREGYYRWLRSKITLQTAASPQQLTRALSQVEFQLQTSTFPEFVMLPKRLLSK